MHTVCTQFSPVTVFLWCIFRGAEQSRCKIAIRVIVVLSTGHGVMAFLAGRCADVRHPALYFACYSTSVLLVQVPGACTPVPNAEVSFHAVRCHNESSDTGQTMILDLRFSAQADRTSSNSDLLTHVG